MGNSQASSTNAYRIPENIASGYSGEVWPVQTASGRIDLKSVVVNTTVNDYVVGTVVSLADRLMMLSPEQLNLVSRYVDSLERGDAEDTKLAMLADSYRAGMLDIPDIATQLGVGWTVPRIVVTLERLGVSRAIPTAPLSSDVIDDIMTKLARISAEHSDHIYDTPEWIEREVVASQRIEGIYVDPL